jgi:hypothetical protein
MLHVSGTVQIEIPRRARSGAREATPRGTGERVRVSPANPDAVSWAETRHGLFTSLARVGVYCRASAADLPFPFVLPGCCRYTVTVATTPRPPLLERCPDRSFHPLACPRGLEAIRT